MNNIEVNPFGTAEHCAMDNWAAEYAKKLFISEAAQRTEDITAEAQVRKAEDSKVRGEFAAADSEIRSEFTAADSALDEKKLNRDEYATETTPGIVTLHRGSTNNSGLLIGSKGELAVNVSPDGKYGLTRDGAGQIKTFAASEDEIADGTNQYKPIVPSTVKSAVESITGKVSDIKLTVFLPDGTTILQPNNNFTAAVNYIDSKVNKIKLDAELLKLGNIGIIDNTNLIKSSTGNGTIGSTKTTLPNGIYFWVPDILYCSLNGLEYKASDGMGLFKKDYLYILELGESKRILYSQYEEENKQTYSIAATRIGTWIDGTPVWKVAIPITPVENIGCTNPKASWDTNAISILAMLDIIADTSNVVYIDSSLIFQNAPYYDNEDFSANSTEYSPGRYNLTARDNDYATHFYGWIEFATPESNIL